MLPDAADNSNNKNFPKRTIAWNCRPGKCSSSRTSAASAVGGKQPFDGLDLPARQMLFEGRGIVNKIALAQRDRENAPAQDGLAQPACDGFDFRKFRHGF